MEIIDNAPIENAALIADAVYFAVIDHLGIESECIEDDDDDSGISTRNTEKGTDLYYLIEGIILNQLGGQNDA